MVDESGRHEDAYEAVFSALAHPARRRVLLTIYFNGGPMAAGEIAAVFSHAWQTTTRHLQILEAAGLLSSARDGRACGSTTSNASAWASYATGSRTSPSRPAPRRRPPDMAAATAPVTRPDTPQLFRLSVEVGDLGRAIAFYSELFGIEGHRQAGARSYFDCGPVTLSVMDVSANGTPHTAAKALYFTVEDLEAVFARAKVLGCLSTELVHDQSAGAIVVRPWGERSFYADDPWGNPLCFVERGTVYAG